MAPYLAVVRAGNIKFTYHSCDPEKPFTKGYRPTPSEKPLTEGYQLRRSEYTGFQDALEASRKLKELGLKVLFEGSDAEEILEARMKKIRPSKLIHVVNRIPKKTITSEKIL